MNTYKMGKCLNVLQNEESLSAVMIKFPILKEVKQFEAYNMGNKSRIRNKEIPTEWGSSKRLIKSRNMGNIENPTIWGSVVEVLKKM